MNYNTTKHKGMWSMKYIIEKYETNVKADQKDLVVVRWRVIYQQGGIKRIIESNFTSQADAQKFLTEWENKHS